MGKKDAITAAAGFVITVIILVVAITLLQVAFGIRKNPNDGLPAQADAAHILVIDAGHGGMDGGAVAADGTTEKGINLEISMILKSLMEVSGVKVVMTRTEDVMLDGSGLSGTAKMRDLKKRLEIAGQYPEALMVSIHCNKFPQESCKGLQVYYSAHEEAESAAGAVQDSYLLIDPTNHRKIKKADSSIYLLSRARVPSILVECGFLSNGPELEKLKTDNYRKKLALVIADGIFKAIGEE